MIAERNATTILRDPYTHKPFVHFYATKLIDLVVAAAVEEEPLAAPPANPVIGATYIVASGATGAWAGNDLALAGYTDGGWRFVAPREGMLAYVVNGSVWAAFRAGSWEIGAVRGESLMIGGQQVVGARAGAIGSPAAVRPWMPKPAARSAKSCRRCGPWPDRQLSEAAIARTMRPARAASNPSRTDRANR